MNPALWLEQHRDWGQWVEACVQKDETVATLVDALREKHDSLYRQVWEWAGDKAQAQGCFVPASSAWFMMGSAGRGEAPLWTDQDHGIYLAPEDEQGDVTVFTHHLVEGLQQAGYPRCPGRVMASEPLWQATNQGWSLQMDRWLTGNRREDARYLMIAADARVVVGKDEGIQVWRRHFLQQIRHYPKVLRREADRRPRTPLGIGGRLLRERYGIHAGKIGIKEGGYLLMVDAFRLWSLVHGIAETSTRQRIQRVGQTLGWPQQKANALMETLDTFLWFRLVGSLEEGETPNYVDPAKFAPSDKQRLKKALSSARNIWREVGRDLNRLVAEKGDRGQ